MPLLIRNINGKVLDDLTTRITHLANVTGSFGYGTWFMVGNVEAFNQDFRKVLSTEVLKTNAKQGLIINNNIEFKEFNIENVC